MLWVQTRKSFYEIDILSPEKREVLVRGGNWLKNWTPARLKRTPNSHPLDDPLAIPVGYPLVLGWNDQTIITSPVVSVEIRN